MGNGLLPPTYFLAGEELRINSEESVRDLGIQIDASLSFRPHVAKAIAKARRSAGFILRSFRYSNAETFGRLFKSYVRPVLEFGSQLFNGRYAADSSALERVQKWYTRRVFRKLGLPTADYEERMKIMKLEKLDLRRDLQDISFTHQCGDQSHFCPQISFAPTTERYPLSHSQRLVTEQRPKAQRRFYFPNRVAKLWNKVPAKWIKLKKQSFIPKARALVGLPVRE
jgi:hypothetical protein